MSIRDARDKVEAALKVLYCFVFYYFLASPTRRGSLWYVSYYRNFPSKVIGNCKFWGPDDFLRNAEAFAEQVKSCDAELYTFLFGEKMMFFPHDPPLRDAYRGIFSIDKEYCVWGAKGIGAMVIYSAIAKKELGNDLRSLVSFARTMQWKRRDYDPQIAKIMRKLDFPETLCVLFE